MLGRFLNDMDVMEHEGRPLSLLVFSHSSWQ